MADTDALLIRKLIVAALEGGDAHTDLGESIRDALSDFLSATWLKRGRRNLQRRFARGALSCCNPVVNGRADSSP